MTKFGLLLHILLNVSISVSIYGYPDLQCPAHSQWDYRAKAYCNITEDYFCLYDVNEKHFFELCEKGPEYDTTGFKTVFVGDIHGVPCEEERFQPLKFWTNGSSTCVFTKSYCQDEGQILSSNGTNKSDRQCRCDYTRGYDFVTRPINRCFCTPSEEDCSCYRKLCPVGSILTPDYDCISTTEWKTKFYCEFITNIRTNNIPQTTQGIFTLVEPKSDRPTNIVGIVVTILFCLLLLIGIVMLFLDGFMTLGIKTEVFVSSDLQEIRNYEKQLLTNQVKNFVETRASEEILCRSKTENCLFISGAPGCGKSSTAIYAALRLAKEENFDLIVIKQPDEFIKYADSNKRQVFLLDDVFGNYAINEYDLMWWKRHGNLVNNIINRTNNTTLIMTSRTHLYKSVDLKQIQISFSHIDLMSDALKLTIDERRKIAKVYMTADDVEKLEEGVLTMYNFFPSLCAKFQHDSDMKLIAHFTTPYIFLDEEFQHFQRSTDINYYSLSLLVIKNNCIGESFFEDDLPEHDKLLKDLAGEIEFTACPLKHMIQGSLTNMNGSYILKTECKYQFLTKNLFEAAAFCVGHFVIRTIFKHATGEFLKNRFQFDSLQGFHGELTIMIPKNLEMAYFDRMLRELKSGHLRNVFTDRQNSFPEYRKHFKEYLKKHMKAPDLKQNIDGSTALHVVSSVGYCDYIIVFTTLDKEMVNKGDNNGRTSLHIACQKGYTQTANILIDNLASIDQIDNDEQTPLDLACKEGHREVIELLLSHGASIKQHLNDLRTALHTACNNGNVKITEMLLAKNAKVNVHDKGGSTPLHLASKKGHLDIISMLLEHGADINCCDGNDRTPLILACQKKHVDAVKLLLKREADVSKVDVEGKSALHYSFELGCKEVIDLILGQNINVNKRDNAGNTPMHFACLKGRQYLVEKLFRYNVDFNIKNKNEQTPLHLACQKDQRDVVQSLVSFGALINLEDNRLRTPLHEACRKGALSVVETLLNYNVDINKADKSGMTPLLMCCEIGHSNLATLLLKFKADVNHKDNEKSTAMHIACREGYIDTVKALLPFQPDLNATDNDGCSPLYIACDISNVDLVSLLLTFDVDINLANLKGDAPLHIASQNGCTEIMELLLKRNAAVNQQDNFKHTPLFKAVSEGHVSAVKLLIENGASIGICNQFRMSPLQIASQKGQSAIVRLLQASES